MSCARRLNDKCVVALHADIYISMDQPRNKCVWQAALSEKKDCHYMCM